MGLPIAEVNVVLNTSVATRQGFGTPIFITTHNNFLDTVRSYSDIEAVGEDFDTTDAAYIAAQQFFGNSPKINTIKIGKRQADVKYKVLGDTFEGGEVISLQVSDNHDRSFTVSVSATDLSTPFTLATALASAFSSNTDFLTDFTVTADSDSIIIAGITADDLAFANRLKGLTAVFSNEASAADTFREISEADSDFYFVTAQDHTKQYVLDMADAVNAAGKLFATSSSDLDSLKTFNEQATDTLAVLRQNNTERTFAVWHQDADTKFIECKYVGTNCMFAPDEQAVVWDGLELTNWSVAKNAKGNVLTSTEMNNLELRNVSYIVNTETGARIIGGKTSGNKWIDELHIRDTMVARVKEKLVTLLMNQKGKKIVGGEAGRLIIANEITEALSPFIGSQALLSFTVDTTRSELDTNTRKLSNVRFTGVLEGAIIRVTVNGELVNQE